MSESTGSRAGVNSSHAVGEKSGGSPGVAASSGNWKWYVLLLLLWIALQLAGMQRTIAALGLHGSGFVNDLPLIVAFLILAAFAYTSGLRAPASIALVKDTMVYILVLAAMIWIPLKFGGFGHIFDVTGQTQASRSTPGVLILPPTQYLMFATLALDSALAGFLCPHTVPGVLTCSSATFASRTALGYSGFICFENTRVRRGQCT
jgi:solute:Na+ symporter, SSS family